MGVWPILWCCGRENKFALCIDIAGLVAAMTESKLYGESEELQSHAWLTGTAFRGGQGVWRFSQIVGELSLGS
jgi:NO-binding membrane sensor protein with MHYT domain